MVEHSCRPNCTLEWASPTKERRLIAAADITKGQCVSRSYVDTLLLMSDKSTRQTALRRDWGFTCACDRCAEDCLSSSRDGLHTKVLDALSPGGRLDIQRIAELTGLLLGYEEAELLREARRYLATHAIPLGGDWSTLLQLYEDAVDAGYVGVVVGLALADAVDAGSGTSEDADADKQAAAEADESGTGAVPPKFSCQQRVGRLQVSYLRSSKT
eukprot:5925526-Amphidinium_carterae.2